MFFCIHHNISTVVIGFPHGSVTTATKVFEAVDAMKNGATELDMVINISALLSGDYAYVEADIRAVVEVAHSNKPKPATVKVSSIFCYSHECVFILTTFIGFRLFLKLLVSTTH
jgi:deoxyribose-phosphate aldolase